MKTPSEHSPGIFIVGCPRSGTTLLRRILDAHPNISAPGETYLFTACARFLATDPSVDGMNIGVINGLGFLGFEEEQILSRLREFAFSFREQHAHNEGKTRWAEKTAIDVFHLDALEKLLAGHGKFIFITRHGVDTAISMQEWCNKSQSYPTELHHYIQRFQQPLVALTHAWADTQRASREFCKRYPDDTLQIRYEDLTADPEQHLKAIFDFLGEEWHANISTTALSGSESKGFSDWKTFSTTKIEAGNAGQWKRLSKETLADLACIANGELIAAGYDPLPETRRSDDTLARRRYEMGLALQSSKRETKKSD